MITSPVSGFNAKADQCVCVCSIMYSSLLLAHPTVKSVVPRTVVLCFVFFANTSKNLYNRHHHHHRSD